MFCRLATIFLAATCIGAASVPFRRQDGVAVTCTLVLGPETPVTTCTNLAAEFNLCTYADGL